MSDPTAVYRLYDAQGTLLYVGMTKDPDARWANHARKKPWWMHVARKSLEWHSTRQGAALAEAAAIASEYPIWNVAIPDENGIARRSDGSPIGGRPAVGCTPGHTFRVPDDVWNQAKIGAKEDGLSMGELVTRLLERHSELRRRRMERQAAPDPSP